MRSSNGHNKTKSRAMPRSTARRPQAASVSRQVVGQVVTILRDFGVAYLVDEAGRLYVLPRLVAGDVLFEALRLGARLAFQANEQCVLIRVLGV